MASGWAVKIGLPKYAELSPDHADAEVQGNAVLQAAYGTLDDSLIRHVTRLHDSFCRLARERQAEERRRPPPPPPPPPLSEPSSPTAALTLTPLPPDAAASCVSCTRMRAPAAAAAAAASEPSPDGGDGEGCAAAVEAAAAALEQRLAELAEQQSQVFQRMVGVVSLSARAAERRHGDERCLEPRPPAEPRPPPPPLPPQARCTKVSGLIRPMLLRAAPTQDDCVFTLQSGTAAAAAAAAAAPLAVRRRTRRPLPPPGREKRNRKRQVTVRAAAPTVSGQRRQRKRQGREAGVAKGGGWDDEAAHAPLVSIRRSDLNARPFHEAAVRFPVPPQPQQPPPPRLHQHVRPSTQPVAPAAAAGRFGQRVVSTPLELPRISVTASRRTRRPLPPGSPRPSAEAAATGAAATAATADVFEEPSTRVKRGLAITPMYEPLSFNTLQFFRQGYAIV